MTRRSPRNGSEAWSTFPVVLLFIAGNVKESPLLSWVPIDLTVLAAALLGFSAMAELRRNARTPAGWAPLVLMSLAFVLPALAVAVAFDGSQKLQLFFLLTLPSAFAASVIVNSAERMWWVARWTVAGGLLMGVLLVLAPTTSEFYGRLAAEGTNTIAQGRGCGAAIVAAVALGIGRKWRWPTVIVISLAMTVVVLGSGSRGPLLAVGVAVVVMTLAQPGVEKIKHLGWLVLLAVMAGPIVLLNTNPAALARIALIFSADRGESVNERARAFSLALDLGAQNFWGVGWGNFERYDPALQYPHNMLLEVFAEAGLIAAVALSVVISVSLLRLCRLRSFPAIAPAFGLLIFWLVNAMFSGAVNDNRATFALLAIGLTLPRALRVRESVVTALVRSVPRRYLRWLESDRPAPTTR